MRALRKRWMSPIAARKLAATITLTPGTAHQPLDLRDSPAQPRRSAARPRRSPESRKVDLADARCRRSRAPRRAARARRATCGPSTPNTSRDGRAPDELAHQHRVDLVLRTRLRACTSCPRRDRRRRITHVASVGHPHRVERSQPPAASRASVRPDGRSSRALGGSRYPPATRRPPARRAARGSARSPTSSPSPLTRPGHPAPGSQRTAQAAQAWSRSDQPSAPSRPRQIATSQKSRCTSNPTRPHPHRLLESINTARRTGGQTTRDGSALEAQPGQVAGAAKEKPGLKALARKAAA